MARRNAQRAVPIRVKVPPQKRPLHAGSSSRVEISRRPVGDVRAESPPGGTPLLEQVGHTW